MPEQITLYRPIPPEIEKFFATHAGEVLLIKGSTGSGKTFLGLQIMEELSKREKGIMLFTRVEEDQLTLQFKQLKEGSDLRKRILMFDKNSRISDPNWFLREFSNIFKSEEKPRVVLIDTIDSLTERFENPTRMIKATLDVVQSENLSLILITEKSDGSFLDPLVGGIVELNFTTLGERKIREMEIIKMRGVELGQSRYLFTLKEGEFHLFCTERRKREEFERWITIKHEMGYYSSGIPELDKVLGGGFKKGSYILLETSYEVSEQMLMLILRPIILNFISNGGVVFITPPGGEAPETIFSDLARFLPKKILEDNLRFIEYFQSESSSPLVVPISDKASQRTYRKILEIVTEGYRRPLLDLVGLDTLEYRVDKEVTPHDLIRARVFIKMNNYIGLAISRENLKVNGAAINFSDIIFKYLLKDNVPSLLGVKPSTSVMVPVEDPKKGIPWVKLVDLV